ncbi:MAG TPA: tannase/feruloyl esterase family alpha/beta hydrolase [Burkholderiales bacterium]
MSTQSVPAGNFQPPTGGPVNNLPAFCRVSIAVDPQINIEVWLPEDWNDRFQAVGGGGYAGNISWSALGNALRSGYATSSTDTGHSAATQPGGSFALNPDGTLNWQLIEDFASRSLFEMTFKAQELMKRFYGDRPKYSYWNGCSTGGRQGLMLAQRLPGAYDGTLSAAPAINWDRFIPAELWPQVAMKLENGAPVSGCKLMTTVSAAVSACDSFDGVVDGILEDPRRCGFDPVGVQQCAPGSEANCDCLTPGEASAVRKIWDGVRSTGGKRLWYGMPRGAPLDASAFGLASSFGGNFAPFPIATDHFRYWIKQDPAFDWMTLDYASFEADFQTSRAKFNDVIGTDDPNLRLAGLKGGKVLMWHGWADQLIFAEGTVDYYERVIARTGSLHQTQKFARLFMAPGVFHCAGGPGPNVFDMFSALVNWVENGQAPERVTASLVQGGAVVRTRPLCLYPEMAVYKGSGSTNDEASFSCETPFDYKDKFIKD